jgi:hypothetical protein
LLAKIDNECGKLAKIDNKLNEMKLSSEFSWLQWFEEGGLVGVTQKERAWFKGGGDKFRGGTTCGLSWV